VCDDPEEVAQETVSQDCDPEKSHSDVLEPAHVDPELPETSKTSEVKTVRFNEVITTEKVNETCEQGPVPQTVEEIVKSETDDTVGPGNESEESGDESGEEIVVQVSAPKTPHTSPTISKPAPIIRKATISSGSLHPKVATLPVVPDRRESSWSRFLPLVIEIKATVPYPMHLLAVCLLVVTGLLLRLLYQFGADLGGEMELQVQFTRLAKLAFLFVVVAACVNFVEDNKEIAHKEDAVASLKQPKLRPSKISKNKKKLMSKKESLVEC